ncbi:MAG: hypothetical protein IIA82_03685 [Thaumarchaeota archaeon]|nr:hypothetical protein [Nitrososphaerota archaeon]
MHCDGSCKKLKAESNRRKGGRYEQGQKRCPQCEIFIEWKGLWCPCCGRLLRTKPRARKLKRQLALRLARKEY